MPHCAIINLIRSQEVYFLNPKFSNLFIPEEKYIINRIHAFFFLWQVNLTQLWSLLLEKVYTYPQERNYPLGWEGGGPDVFTNFHDIYIFATFFFY